jgi:predicted RNase H-like HicB family nuclease
VSYDDWKCNPPDLDHQQHCDCCGEHAARAEELTELVEWLYKNHGRWFALKPANGTYRVAMHPWSGAVSDGATPCEALEKLKGENE